MKLKTVYRCQTCGFESLKWLGQCPDCKGWSTLIEEVKDVSPASAVSRKSLTDFSCEPVKLADASAMDVSRTPSGISELDRLLNGGFVEGQIVLLAGEPGIGKSTIILQTAQYLAQKKKVLYITGEESVSQVSSRAKRLGVSNENILLACETNLEKIISLCNEVKPGVLIVDSIQTLYHPQFSSVSGAISQVRESAGELLRVCKPKGIILILLGHVTKEGALAGPKVLEHIVDTVLYFDTQSNSVLRVLRAFKNRFGSTSEVGIFQMTQSGLKAVDDASLHFHGESRKKPMKGRAFSMAVEGSRPILCEIQALVSSTHFPYPRRMATGLDLNRCQMLFAAVEKHLGLNLETKDIFVTLAGGMKITDSALDIAVCSAVISSAMSLEINPDVVFIGELGILGQTGRVSQTARRLEEAQRLGFKKAFFPGFLKDEEFKSEQIKTIEVAGLDELAKKLEVG